MSSLRRSDPNLRPVRPNPQVTPTATAKVARAKPLGEEDSFVGDRSGSGEARTLTQRAEPNAAIPDLGKVTSTLRFEDAVAIEKLTVAIDVKHTWRADLRVTLTSPSGRSVVLHDRKGGAADDLVATFDLAQLQGEPARGDWTLTVEDLAKRDTGTLRAWSLAVTGRGAPAPATGGEVKIASFDDDPMVQAAHVEQLSKSDFELGNDGRVKGLVGPNVRIVEGPSIAQTNSVGALVPFATNPWSLPEPTAAGGFDFTAEERFPLHRVELGEDGKPKTNAGGLQLWTPRADHLAQTTAFEAANTVLRSAEGWLGRDVAWGKNGQMEIEPHAFIGLNANYNPTDRKLRFGVVPYKTAEGELRMFEMASSWEVVAHEAGHSVQDNLKPNKGLVDLGYRQWGESFGDQLAMWSSLQDPERVDALLQETGGDLSRPNALSRIAEAYGTLSGKPGTGLRDATNTLAVKDTSTQFHERSQVLTGATYQVFLAAYAGFQQDGLSPADALREAGEVMGTFLTRAADHTPENSMTLEDVGKAYLKVDQEYFGGRYFEKLSGEFTARGLFGAQSVAEWRKHEAALPPVRLGEPSRAAAERLLAEQLPKLGLGGGFGARLQSFELDDRGQAIVRIQLQREGKVANNHGVLVFRPDGSLMDFQNPMPGGLGAPEAAALLARAQRLGLDRHGMLGLVAKAGGGFTVQVVKETPGGADPHLSVFTLEEPQGQRAEYFHVERSRETAHLEALLPPGARPVRADEAAARPRARRSPGFAGLPSGGGPR